MIHVPINVKSPNNNNKWKMGFNSAFEGLTDKIIVLLSTFPVGIPSHHIWNGGSCCDNGFFAGKGIFFYLVSERKSVQFV